ncbi:MAG: TetR/AcrR family transcriptional regulator [Deltaproteobacteria bacterium]|nr:TetR/AcrR family transcriptional regulator [Deltaproteobacteria bacterium]
MPKDTFYRISREKQSMVLDTAAKEFAANGFHKANVNTIASNAGISVGSMYKYFSSKEDLFSETLENGIRMLREDFFDVLDSNVDTFTKIRRIFELPVTFAREKPYYLNLYLNLLSGGMEYFAEKYARRIESVGSEFFKKLVKDGIDSGQIDNDDIDIDVLTFFLDNHLMMFTFSQVSLYLKLRKEEFLGDNSDTDYIIDNTVEILRKVLGRPSVK